MNEVSATHPHNAREQSLSDSDFEFDVFLSYRRSDGSGFAKRFRRLLQNAHRRLPVQAKPMDVYLDRIQARADLDFYRETVRPAVLSSRWLVLVATPNAKERPEGQNDWIARELEDFIAHRGLEFVRVVHAKGDTLPELPHELNPQMEAAQKIDLRGLFGLLPSSQAQEDWESLLATLFALEADHMPDLRREEEKLQRTRLARVAGGVVGAAVFATGLSGYAIYQNAISVRNVDRAAAILAANFDPEQPGACDGLEALWSNGATRRAVPAMTCLIARADFHWFNDDFVRARAVFGTWDAFTATLPSLGSDLRQELAEARHLYEYNLLQYEQFEAVGSWFGDPIPADGRATSLRALAEVERALGEVDYLESVPDHLHNVLWPLLNSLEATGNGEEARAIMIRAASALEPHAQFSMRASASPNDPWVLDYGLLARRIAYYANAVGEDDLAKTWSDKAIDAFGSFQQTEPEGLYQHALARIVHGSILEERGEDARLFYETAKDLNDAAISLADVDWERWKEAQENVTYLKTKTAP